MQSAGTSLGCGVGGGDWCTGDVSTAIPRSQRSPASSRVPAVRKGRSALLPGSSRLLMLVWLVVVLAPLATVGIPALEHAVLYLAPALVFLVPLCLNRDPAGRLLVQLARPRRTSRGKRDQPTGSALGAFRYSMIWTARAGLLLGLTQAGRAPPLTP